MQADDAPARSSVGASARCPAVLTPALTPAVLMLDGTFPVA
jgi:hypothetical protein